MQVASLWGVRMRVNLQLQQWIEVYARGAAIGTESRRTWKNYFRQTSFEVPLFQRLVVLFRPRKDHPQEFDFRYVYLRMFKNIPHEDIDMMLPGSGIQMNWFDHSRILLPSLFTAGITLWRIMRNVFLLALFGVFKSIGIGFLVLVAIGYGLKNLFTFRSNVVRRYQLNMTQSLYYQSLGNNAGVLLRILDEGEQQESCQIILVYFACLLADFQPISTSEIQRMCRAILGEATGLQVNFDADGAVSKLARLGVFQLEDSGWRALPLTDAITRLDQVWDDWFTGPSIKSRLP
jgi:hypothetical protein